MLPPCNSVPPCLRVEISVDSDQLLFLKYRDLLRPLHKSYVPHATRIDVQCHDLRVLSLEPDRHATETEIAAAAGLQLRGLAIRVALQHQHAIAGRDRERRV